MTLAIGQSANMRLSLHHALRLIAGSLLALLCACTAHAPTPPREPPILRVGMSGDYPPFSEVRDGQVSGFDAELLQAFAAERVLVAPGAAPGTDALVAVDLPDHVGDLEVDVAELDLLHDLRDRRRPAQPRPHA